MDIKTLATDMDEMVSKGVIVGAIKKYFSDEADTSDYSEVKTSGKAQMVEKMEGFVGSIAKVNGIEHHRTTVDEDSSASEFTFDFDMKDGSKILWHEIIRRIWKDGKVINEQYFNAA